MHHLESMPSVGLVKRLILFGLGLFISCMVMIQLPVFAENASLNWIDSVSSPAPRIFIAQNDSAPLTNSTSNPTGSSNHSLQVLHVESVRPNYYFYQEPFINPYNAEIEAAMEQWHQANPDAVKFRQVGNDFPTLDLYVMLTGDCMGYYSGLYSASSHLIVICTENNHHHFDRSTIYQITLHEIGHAIGFPHDNDKDIMNPKLLQYSYENCQIGGSDLLYFNETCDGVIQKASAGIQLNQISDDEIMHDKDSFCGTFPGVCILGGQLAPMGDKSQWKN